MSENLFDKSLKYDEKAHLRNLSVTRGAFNRSLRQARQNVSRSIYTILLIGYLGILEELSLEPYIEAANKLKTYVNTQRELAKKNPNEEYIRIIEQLHNELNSSLNELTKPTKISKKTWHHKSQIDDIKKYKYFLYTFQKLNINYYCFNIKHFMAFFGVKIKKYGEKRFLLLIFGIEKMN